ncbi:unnamed protein product [Absidia cylindrospora]
MLQTDAINVSGICVQYPSSGCGFYADDTDVTWALYQLQQLTLNKTLEGKLSWESHVHHLLSLNYVLLVTPGRIHDDVRHVFGDDGVDAVQTLLAARFDPEAFEFNKELNQVVTTIVKKVRNGKMHDDSAVVELMSLKPKASDLEFKVIKSIKACKIECLPNEVVNEPPNELELVPRSLPFIWCPRHDVLFRWHDTMNQRSATISRHHPDDTVRRLTAEIRPDSSISTLKGKVTRSIIAAHLGKSKVSCTPTTLPPQGRI